MGQVRKFCCIKTTLGIGIKSKILSVKNKLVYQMRKIFIFLIFICWKYRVLWIFIFFSKGSFLGVLFGGVFSEILILYIIIVFGGVGCGFGFVWGFFFFLLLYMEKVLSTLFFSKNQLLNLTFF